MSSSENKAWKIQACMGFAPMTTTIPAQRFQHAFFWQPFSKELYLLFAFFRGHMQ